MRFALMNAPLITPDGLQTEPLIIETGRRQILPSNRGNEASINLEGYMIYPALVNAHDHLELNHFPRTKFRDTYFNAREWSADVSKRLDDSPYLELRKAPLNDRCFIGGLKNLLCGATLVAHHNPLHRPLKKNDFPVRVLKKYGWSHSLYLSSQDEIRKSYLDAGQRKWMIHLAEGIDDFAASELGVLAELNVLGPSTILIHGVGLTEADTQLAIERGASLVWCPSTNFYLLGQTATVQKWAAAGQLMLGSDSRLTADGNLLDELRTAQRTGQLSDQALFRLVTTNPRQLLSGSENLAQQLEADFIGLPYQPDPYQALIKARRADLSLVIRGGQVMIGDPALVKKFPGNFEPALLDGKEKWIATSLAQRLRRCTLNEAGLQLLTR
jgi:cytosine/adenosine deaminase-related metal-dependent hydrolase